MLPLPNDDVITIVCDGGSRGNGTQNAGYGSFRVFHEGKNVPVTVAGKKHTQPKFDWPDSTNNAAELKTAYTVLQYIAELCERMNEKQMALPKFRIMLDSQLTEIALTKGVKKPAAVLKPLYQKIADWKLNYGGVVEIEVQRIPDTEVKQILGH
jgi:ribonuclease HI